MHITTYTYYYYVLLKVPRFIICAITQTAVGATTPRQSFYTYIIASQRIYVHGRSEEGALQKVAQRPALLRV